MTKRLEELFNMNEDPSIEESLDTPILPQENDDQVPAISQGMLDTIAKVEEALPQVKGLESSDAEMDDLAGLAKEAFNNLMDLGMQVRSSSRFRDIQFGIINVRSRNHSENSESQQKTQND
jgi:hypothetical protein